MRIIDAHVHLGDCRMCEYDYSETDLEDAVRENGVAVSILQPFPNAGDARKVHARIAALAERYPGRFFGIISVNPHRDKHAYRNEIKEMAKAGRFVAVKLHTLGHAVFPDSKDAHSLYEIASELRLPVMVHTGLTNFGEPALLIGPARMYPQTKFILAHAGWGGHAAQAIAAAKAADNIYLETSWISVDDKLSVLSAIGSERVMLGSDTLLNMGVEIFQYQTLFKKGKISDVDLARVFHGVAERVFAIPPEGGEK
jgi:predicted TIM-barrel fold metal-dependent hydrolase